MALAMVALPWQVDAERIIGGHDSALPAHHAVGVANDEPTHEPTDKPERGTHEHGAECFWCVAVVGTLIGRTLALSVAVTVPMELPVTVAYVSERSAAHDAAPRAPPARTATQA